MKSFNLNIHPELKNVNITVKNGRKFSDSLIKGEYCEYYIQVCDEDLPRVKNFAVRYANHFSSGRGNWYAQCNGFAMGLLVSNAGNAISINTYRPYGKTTKP